MADLRRRIGRWRVDSTLGSGGMGEVYLAHRGKERAAVKVIQPGLAQDPHFRDRFHREVAVSRVVTGPHIAELIDADVEAETPWLASRYIGGPSLAHQVSMAGPLDQSQATAVALALASALEDIHAAGVIHRDLKPANVLLAPGGPVVIDFGIAAAADATSLTGTGTVVGSAGWMAPEQLRGDDTGPAADVFAWAATVGFAATGRSPFGNGRPEAVAYRVAHAPPDLSSVPEPLRTLVQRGLDKDPAGRPTVAELIAALRPSVAGAPTLAAAITSTWSDATIVHAPGFPKEAQKRGRPLVFGMAALAALLIAGAVGIGVLRDRGEASAAEPEPGREPSTTDVSVSEGSASSTRASSTTTTRPPSTSTTAPPTTRPTPPTQPPPPPTPEMVTDLSPTNDEHIRAVAEFAAAHQQEAVRLELRWDDPGDTSILDPRPDASPGYLFLRGSCPSDDFSCASGMEILINDLNAVPDANLFYDNGQWVVSGRFAVQGLDFNMGVQSVALRALPIE